MRVLIIGAGGMIGSKLATSICGSGTLGGAPVTALHGVDLQEPDLPPNAPPASVADAADLSEPGVPEDLIATRPDVIYHLVAIVSGGAEQDFELGYRINLDATRALFEAIRLAHLEDGYCPRLIFTSSLAVFGAPLPDPIPDTHILTPHTSYGTQKAIAELLIDDYSRRGFFDGIALRLPTIVIRPGAPNAAASGFFSGILREPLAGKPTVLPVPEETKHWLASPSSAVGYLLHAAGLETERLGHHRALTMPGVATTVAGQIEALERVAGPEAVALIERRIEPAIANIIATWPKSFDTARALELGFTAETTVDALIAEYQANS